jgi:hypothetical protein
MEIDNEFLLVDNNDLSLVCYFYREIMTAKVE